MWKTHPLFLGFCSRIFKIPSEEREEIEVSKVNVMTKLVKMLSKTNSASGIVGALYWEVSYLNETAIQSYIFASSVSAYQMTRFTDVFCPINLSFINFFAYFWTTLCQPHIPCSSYPSSFLTKETNSLKLVTLASTILSTAPSNLFCKYGGVHDIVIFNLAVEFALEIYTSCLNVLCI